VGGGNGSSQIEPTGQGEEADGSRWLTGCGVALMGDGGGGVALYIVAERSRSCFHQRPVERRAGRRPGRAANGRGSSPIFDEIPATSPSDAVLLAGLRGVGAREPLAMTQGPPPPTAAVVLPPLPPLPSPPPQAPMSHAMTCGASWYARRRTPPRRTPPPPTLPSPPLEGLPSPPPPRVERRPTSDPHPISRTAGFVRLIVASPA